MVIDHVGIVVKSIELSIEHWNEVFGYQQLTEIVINSIQKVKVVFLHKKNSITVKLVEPTDESSPVYRFAMRGGGLHHLCFKCNNLSNELMRLTDLGFRTLAEPQPGEAFDGENIAFIYLSQGLNVELIETDKKAKLLLKSGLRKIKSENDKDSIKKEE